MAAYDLLSVYIGDRLPVENMETGNILYHQSQSRRPGSKSEQKTVINLAVYELQSITGYQLETHGDKQGSMLYHQS